MKVNSAAKMLLNKHY